MNDSVGVPVEDTDKMLHESDLVPYIAQFTQRGFDEFEVQQVHRGYAHDCMKFAHGCQFEELRISSVYQCGVKSVLHEFLSFVSMASRSEECRLELWVLHIILPFPHANIQDSQSHKSIYTAIQNAREFIMSLNASNSTKQLSAQLLQKD